MPEQPLDLDLIRQLLAELRPVMQARSDAWNQRFQANFRGNMKNFTGAVREASQAADHEEHERIQQEMARICRFYLSASDDGRGKVRALFAEDKLLLHNMSMQVGWAAKKISSAADVEWLRIGLAAAAIEDLRTDYRDVYLALGGLWMAAHAAGIEPGSYFEEAADMASSARLPSLHWSMREFLQQFKTSAFFAADVKPRLGR